MATKNEKIVCASIGLISGLIIGYNYAKNKGITEKELWKYLFGFGISGIIVGYIVSILFGTPSDTLNYILKHSHKNVYHGITYGNRIEQRKFEHKRSGKLFTEMVVSELRPRCEALVIEKKLIKKDRPIYNIHHNC
ncbi:MAG: hypothetical protein ABJR05_05240 [Balneola sp.]